MFILRPQSKLPIFEQLKAQILEFISLGILMPNDKLPSVRSLANELGINPNTVAKAYAELELQGYIYTVQGKGCFVSTSNVEAQIKAVKLQAFREVSEEMKQHNIKQAELQEILNELYQGGTSDVED